MSGKDVTLMQIEPAGPSDVAAIRWLLEYERLPASDLDESALDWFLVGRNDVRPQQS